MKVEIFFPKDWHWKRRDTESNHWQDLAIENKVHFGWTFWYSLVFDL